MSRFGGLDLLVNNAGAIHPARDLADFAPEDWRAVIEVNLTAAFRLSRAALSNWSWANGTTTLGRPARKDCPVVPMPPWCTVPAIFSSSDGSTQR